MSWEEGYQQGQGRAAIGENAGLRNTVGNYANALAEANATIDEAQAIIIAKNQRINVLNKSLADCTQEVHDFRLKLIVKTAHAAGLDAYLDAFNRAHPNSPVLADSGKRYKESGNIKTCGRTIYEEDFDRIISNHDIENPEQFRAD